MNRINISAFFTFIILILVASCTTRTIAPTVSKNELWQEQQKQQLLASQEKLDKQMNKKVKRAKQEERLFRVASKIMKSGIELCPKLSHQNSLCVYELELLEKGPLNAFADGEKMYFTPAIVNFAKDDEHLAFLIAHEYSHNLMGHISNKQFNAALGAVAGAMLDGVFGINSANKNGFANLGAQLGALSYSQAFEAEADYVALYIMARAGYDISKAPDVWRKMSLKNPDSIFVAVTHPTAPARFIAMEKAVKEIQTKISRGQALLPALKSTQEIIKANNAKQ